MPDSRVIETTCLKFSHRFKTKDSVIRISEPTHLKITAPSCGVLTYVVNGCESVSIHVTPSDVIFIVCTSPCSIQIKFKRIDY